jgi:peptide/nickel transport system substrate-binding protein
LDHGEIAAAQRFSQILSLDAPLAYEISGLPDAFEFDLQYGNGAITGTSFAVLAQKVQADLARVGIMAKLAPLDMVTFRT